MGVGTTKAEGIDADKAKILPTYIKAYVDANQVNGKLMALPYFADAQFLYYRKDLLEKYKRPVPKSWDEMIETAKIIMDGEKSPQLQGFSTAGSPIEGTVCTYLVPLWGAGGELTKAGGKLNLDAPQARQPFQLYGRMKQAGVLPKNIAEIPTDRIRIDIPNRAIDVLVSDEELAKRRAAWKAPEPRYERGYGWMFTRHIKQANEGCDFDFLETSFGKPVVEPSIY